jgi:hypothetical protein
VKCFPYLVKLAQFRGDKGFCAVVRYQNAKFVPGVDVPLFGSGFHQRRFGVLVLGKEDRFPERLSA